MSVRAADWPCRGGDSPGRDCDSQTRAGNPAAQSADSSGRASNSSGKKDDSSSWGGDSPGRHDDSWVREILSIYRGVVSPGPGVFTRENRKLLPSAVFHSKASAAPSLSITMWTVP